MANNRSSKAKKTSCAQVLVLLLVAVACLAVLAGIALTDRLPRLVTEKFGPPGQSLSLPQQITYSIRLLSAESALLEPVDPQGEPRAFTIELGETVDSIAYRLESERLIPSANAFRTYLIYSGLDTAVQAGKYELSPAMTPVEIARALLDPVPADVEFFILPGWRVEEIANALPSSGIRVSPADFLDLVQNPPAGLLPDGVEQAEGLEGFLAPGSYTIPRDISASDLATMFVNRFDENITPDLLEGFSAQGLNVYEAVTLASVVQREAVVKDEQPLIASVFFNRLAIGMKLESDPTVQYALGYQLARDTWWKNPLSLDDLRHDSRYNTYVYPGLPPGPIANPGIDALRSVAYPAQTGYYFFRAQCDGSGRHFFAVTFEEHINNACR